MSTAAFADDEAAYQRLVEPHRRELHAHCYRMLGSVQDAEDALQDALLRAWRGARPLRGPQLAASLAVPDRHQHLPGRDRPAPQRVLRSARRRRRRSRPSGSTRSRTPCSRRPARPRRATSARESVELSFIAALQYLPANQRAVLILRDVLGFSATESPRRSRPRPPRSTAPCSARGRRRAPARAAPSSPPCATLDDDAIRTLLAALPTPGNAPTSTPSSGCSPTTRRSRCRPSPLVSRPRGDPRVSPARAAVDPAPLRPRLPRTGSWPSAPTS